MNEFLDEAVLEINFQKLTETQKRIVTFYGLDVTKSIIEILPIANSLLPPCCESISINSFARIQAVDPINKVRYGFFSNPFKWVESNNFKPQGEVYSIEDFKEIYQVFEMQKYTVSALSSAKYDINEILQRNKKTLPC